ncbi:hypothetical protein BTO10_15030 [Vibrio chagasii]|uniref:Uncharacterized protein n=1 Tax=Vibrio chagasii TaxID=170679 RepID=A0A2S7VER4_9VIBR|nr:hypothetical protein [Vibrio chagasii]PQJ60656.1 hypothetical protein BTO10_15030 [Vibrio chagasii]
MKCLTISDDDINFKASKWILEELLSAGCDSFSYEELDSKCDDSISFKDKLRRELSKYSLGVCKVQTLFYNQGADNWYKESKVYAFNRDSMPLIIGNMGNNLLDWDVHLNKGVANWHFYKGGTLLAGVNVDDDFISVNNPSVHLIELLEKMGIEYSIAFT